MFQESYNACDQFFFIGSSVVVSESVHFAWVCFVFRSCLVYRECCHSGCVLSLEVVL
jgi:hypothetical protein